MRVSALSFDLARMLTGIAAILLMVGEIPFNAISVGALVLGALTRLEFRWER